MHRLLRMALLTSKQVALCFCQAARCPQHSSNYTNASHELDISFEDVHGTLYGCLKADIRCLHSSGYDCCLLHHFDPHRLCRQYDVGQSASWCSKKTPIVLKSLLQAISGRKCRQPKCCDVQQKVEHLAEGPGA